MSSEKKILEILQKSKEIRLHDLVEITGISRQMVHRAVKSLVERGIMEKIGTPPKTYYRLRDPTPIPAFQLDPTHEAFLQEHFLQVTEAGKKLAGVDAMIYWCQRQKLPIEKTITEFVLARRKYLAYFKPNGLIDGLQKLQNTKGLGAMGLDYVYYLDFYAIERFGKTRLGTLLHLAKQGQNRKLMDEIIELSKDRVYRWVNEEKISAVGYIPPTIKREVQFMKVLQRKLNLSLPHIELTKVTGEIAVPQKALIKIEERVTNARVSIMVRDRRNFQNVLLIDDAIGSGATLNETALKLKEQGVAEIVLGLAITGSFKGFEVIQEV
jgi:biotin operon repressor